MKPHMHYRFTANIHQLIFALMKCPQSVMIFTFLYFTIFLPSSVYSLPRFIRIGGVFSSDEIEQAAVFRYAIDRLNDDQSLLNGSRLQAHSIMITADDSFHGHKKVCSLLQNGSIALFGPLSSRRVYLHVQSISDSLEIPHIQFDWSNSWSAKQRNQLSLNLYPNGNKLARAYIDLVRAWGWKIFAILYDANDGLIRVQEFLKESEHRGWTIQIYRFNSTKAYRDVFWEIKQSRIYNVLLDVKREEIFTVLKQAQQVGMMTAEQNYLITSLDLHTVDLENFQYSTTKITSFRLVDPNHGTVLKDIVRHLKSYGFYNSIRFAVPGTVRDTILTESALLYDSVRLFARGLQDLDQSQSISMLSAAKITTCDQLSPWAYGTSLMNYMRQIVFHGVTGAVGFDQQGKRTNFRLDVVTLTTSGLNKIGIWNEAGNSVENRLNISEEYSNIFRTATLENRTLVVTTILNDPYCMYTESSERKIGNDRFEGFVIDLISELSQLLGFKYVFKLVDDGKYGTNDNGKWNGLIGEVVNHKADIAVVDLTITSKRAEAVDFTLPFMNTGISILFKKPTTKVTTLFSFLSPFTGLVWVYVLAAYIGVSTVLFLVGRLSPYEWENPNPCQQEEDVLENNFNLPNSFFFTIGSLMQQGSDLAPKAMSTRAVVAVWYFFTLIMISSYTANLAAFLTVEKVVYPINSAEDLSMQSRIEYGCLGSGSTRAFFKDSNITIFKRMWQFMQSRPHVFMSSNKDGRNRVEKGSYAYLMESASIEYIIERNCNLTQIGGLLDTKGYGIATRKNSPYRHLLSQAILVLQESGRLHLLKDKWWKQKKGGGACAEDSKKSQSGSVTALKIDNVGGVFVVLIGGLSLAFCVAIFEFLCDSRKMVQSCDSICEEMVSDLKFSLKCHSKTKPNRDKTDSIDTKNCAELLRHRSLSSSNESQMLSIHPQSLPAHFQHQSNINSNHFVISQQPSSHLSNYLGGHRSIAPIRNAHNGINGGLIIQNHQQSQNSIHNESQNNLHQIHQNGNTLRHSLNQLNIVS